MWYQTKYGTAINLDLMQFISIREFANGESQEGKPFGVEASTTIPEYANEWFPIAEFDTRDQAATFIRNLLDSADILVDANTFVEF